MICLNKNILSVIYISTKTKYFVCCFFFGKLDTVICSHHLLQTPIHYPHLDWPGSSDFNAFKNAISVNSAQQPTPITIPSHSTYFPQPKWSDPNNFQLFIEITILAQVPQSGPIGYSLPKWYKSNDFSLNEAFAILTQLSLPKFSSFPLDFAGCQQSDYSGVTGLQYLYTNSSNRSSIVY